jgi:hypothetical protein
MSSPRRLVVLILGGGALLACIAGAPALFRRLKDLGPDAREARPALERILERLDELERAPPDNGGSTLSFSPGPEYSAPRRTREVVSEVLQRL